MALVKYDTELLVNTLAAVPVPAGSHFTTVLDIDTKRPAIISLSSDPSPKLQLVKEDSKGLQQLIDLRHALQISESLAITDFAAEQDIEGHIYLAVATSSGGPQSEVFVAEPFTTREVRADGMLQMMPRQRMSKVRKLFMGPVTKARDFPLVIASTADWGRPSTGTDLTRVLANSQRGALQLLKDFKLPENADEIISVCAGSHPVRGKGIWVLYKIQGSTRLVGEFGRPDEDDETNFRYYYANPPCPDGATTIATYADGHDGTNLLIGAGAGLYHFTGQAALKANTNSQLIAQDDYFKSPKDLRTSQDGNKLSIWSLGQEGVLGYITADATQMPAHDAGVKLTDINTTSAFSVAIASGSDAAGTSTTKQFFLTNDEHSNVSILAQNRDTGIWHHEPFAIADESSSFNINSYTFHTAVLDQNNFPVSEGQLKLESSSDIVAYVNGNKVNISTNGTWVKTDHAGLVAIIVPTDGISGRSLHCTEIKDRKGNTTGMRQSGGYLIDPSQKVMNAFSGITKDTDLTKLTTKNGQPLWPDHAFQPSNDDLKNAAEAFANANTAVGELRPNQIKRNGGDAAAKAKGFLLDELHYLQIKIHEAKEWAIKKVNGIWKFVCKLGDEVKEFVLNSVEKVGSAMDWVWQKIKLGIEKLIDFAGFVFSTSDILTAKNSILGLLNGVLDYCHDSVSTAESKAEKFFDELHAKVQPGQVPKTTTVTTDANDHTTSDVSTRPHDTAAYNFILQHLRNGPSISIDQTIPKDFFNDTASFDETFAALGDDMCQTAHDASQALASLFHGNHQATNEDIKNKFAAVLGDGINIAKDVTLILLKGVAKMIEGLKKLGNAKIHVPGLSAFLKARGIEPQSTFDLICIVLGFLATVATKLATGKALPELRRHDASFIRDLIDGKLSKSEKAEFSVFSSGLSLSATSLYALYSIISTLKKLADEGTGGSISKVSPSRATLTIKSIIGVITAFVSYPSSSAGGSYEARKWAVYVASASVMAQFAWTWVKGGGDQASNKKIETFRLLLALSRFGLYEKAYIDDLNAPATADFSPDTELAVFGALQNVENTIAASGRAVLMLVDDLEIQAVGVVVEQFMYGALQINKGLTLHRTSETQALNDLGVVPEP